MNKEKQKARWQKRLAKAQARAEQKVAANENQKRRDKEWEKECAQRKVEAAQGPNDLFKSITAPKKTVGGWRKISNKLIEKVETEMQTERLNKANE